jgi:hypothetical protein
MRYILLSVLVVSSCFPSGCSETKSFLKGAGDAVPSAAGEAAVKALNDPTPVGLVEAALSFVGDVVMGGIEAVQNNKTLTATLAAAAASGVVVQRKRRKKKASKENASV